MLTASKSRQTAASFRMNNPFSGTPYVEPLTDDTPSIYDCQFRFTARQKSAFWQWFVDPAYCDKGRNAFNLNIDVEGGYAEQECQFMADGTPQLTSEQGGVYTYSARIIVRQLNDPDNGYAEELLTMGELTDGNIDAGLIALDIAVNRELPEG